MDNEYYQKVLKFIKELTPGTTVEISKIATDTLKFEQTVKQIIDKRAIEVEFSNDYKFIKRLEDLDYGRYKNAGKRN